MNFSGSHARATMRFARFAGVAAGAVVAALMVGTVALAGTRPDLPGSVTEYPIPTSQSSPQRIVFGPDGAFWFTEGIGQIGRITLDGAITEFALPTPASDANGITVGPDGSLWFTEQTGNRIGRITTAGVVTEFPPLAAEFSNPTSIVAGPDGALWFNESIAGRVSKVGRITTDGTLTEITPTPNIVVGDLTLGSDGAFWFPSDVGSIGRLTTDGAISQIPAPPEFSGALTAGPDGALWAVRVDGLIYRVTTDRAFGSFGPDLPNIIATGAIGTGPDGAVWYGERTMKGFGADDIGRVTTDGVINEFAPPVPRRTFPTGFAAGPDNAMWFTDPGTNAIGRYALAPLLLGSPPPFQAQTDTNPAGRAEAFRTTALGNGHLTNVDIYLDQASTATSVNLGLYSDAGTHPGRLISQTTITTPANGAWNPTPITTDAQAGKRYWIAILAPTGTGTIAFRDRCCGGSGATPSETSAQTTLTTLPTNWRTGQTYPDGPLSAYGN